MTFLLPGAGTRPSGGFKVVYQYANAFAARNHHVAIVHPASMPHVAAERITTALKRKPAFVVKGALRSWRPDGWFRVDPRVRMLWVPALLPEFVPDADAIVATWWQTAERLAGWPAGKGRKYYLLQHLETWGGPLERVLATWRLPLEKIVIAGWLEQTARQLGERSYYIPNGLDFAAFGMDVSAGDRKPASVAMLYHDYDWKGSSDGIAALQLAKSLLPELRAELFGTGRAPPSLPHWISYHRNPRQDELRAIYNRAAIFVSPSWTEGWPLPPAEALACGCALVCTDIGGHREYAVENRTALMSQPREPTALAHSIVRLATDAELRYGLSAQGHARIRAFTVEHAAEKLEALLTRAAVHGIEQTTDSSSRCSRSV